MFCRFCGPFLISFGVCPAVTVLSLCGVCGLLKVWYVIRCGIADFYYICFFALPYGLCGPFLTSFVVRAAFIILPDLMFFIFAFHARRLNF